MRQGAGEQEKRRRWSWHGVGIYRILKIGKRLGGWAIVSSESGNEK
jgi:hypothetical protein